MWEGSSHIQYVIRYLAGLRPDARRRYLICKKWNTSDDTIIVIMSYTTHVCFASATDALLPFAYTRFGSQCFPLRDLLQGLGGPGICSLTGNAARHIHTIHIVCHSVSYPCI